MPIAGSFRVENAVSEDIDGQRSGPSLPAGAPTASRSQKMKGAAAEKRSTISGASGAVCNFVTT